jgi:hypothetical protein
VHGNTNGTLAERPLDGSGNVKFWDEMMLAQGIRHAHAQSGYTNGAAPRRGRPQVTGDLVTASCAAAAGTSPDGIVACDRQASGCSTRAPARACTGSPPGVRAS